MQQSTAAPPGDRFIDYLRDRLSCSEIAFLEPPTALTGGYDTRIYSFRLQGAAPDFSGRLVVRIFPSVADAPRATREVTLQNAVADQGYPVPRVLLVCTDDSPVEMPFSVMQFVGGKPLLDLILSPSLIRVPGILAKAHARLHSLDPLPVVHALKESTGDSPRSTAEAWLSRAGGDVNVPGLDGLLPGLAWLEANRPRKPEKPSIVHGDFHPVNVLVEHGSVTGVIDWGNGSVGDPVADVAITRIIMTMGPLDVPAALRIPVALIRRWLVYRYTAIYQRLRPLERRNLRYFEALRCYAAMVQVGRLRLLLPERSPTYAWNRPEQVRLMTKHFQRVTGVPLILPPDASAGLASPK